MPRRDVLKVLSAIPVAALAPVRSETRNRPRLYFICSEGNDLYRVARASGIDCSRYGRAEEAVAHASHGSGLLILADAYPDQTTQIDPQVYREAGKRGLRLYVEFPAEVPDLRVGEPQHVAYGYYHNILERVVVASDAFKPALERLRILDVHNCLYVPITAPTAELVMARVAGFDTAVYGLPQDGVHAILFKHPKQDILVAATKLSEFVEGRYAPPAAWPYVWRWIFEWLSPRQHFALLHWEPVVHPAFGRNQHLPVNAELDAFRKGISWFSQAKMLVSSSRKKTVYKYAATSGKHPGPSASWPSGDGSDGVLEGFSSEIEWNGTQPVSWNIRVDCIGEVAMAMAFSGVVESTTQNSKAAENLNDFLYLRSEPASAPQNDPRSPSFGLIAWYGDGSARALLGTMATAGLLQSSRWDEKVLRCLLANLRTTGALGFRHNSLTESELQKFGWHHFYNEKFVNYHPHYEAYLWACFLRAYGETRYAPFLDRTRTAIRMTMAAYPDQWHWTNGLQQERARMLLPLSWLVRVQDTPEHRGWLKRIALDILSFQDKSGAIQEEVGAVGKGQFGPPKSNSTYGTSEAPLLQQNGDPVCDLLYTTNFAFLGLHEAAEATHDLLYSRAEDKLANFLCRIQIQSERHPELAGGWFRAFDFGRWDYWASGADWGWGPWSIETGWTQTWICGVLAMRHLRTSLWDVTGRSGLRARLNDLVAIMFSR